MKRLFMLFVMAMAPLAMSAQENGQQVQPEKATTKACCSKDKKDGAACHKDGKEEKVACHMKNHLAIKTTKIAAKTVRIVAKTAKTKNLAAKMVRLAARTAKKENLAAKTAKVKMVSLVEKTKTA